jgi:hypothetical protein
MVTNKSFVAIVEAFRGTFTGVSPSTRQAIRNLHNVFEDTEGVAGAVRNDRPKSAASEENVRTVSEAFVQ